MRPAQRAVAGVDPQVAGLLAAADDRDVVRRAGTQAGPVVGLAGIGHAGEELLVAPHQGRAAHLGRCGGEVEVEARELGGAGDADVVAEPRDGDLARVVQQADDAGGFRLLQAQRGRVALGRVDVQELAQRAHQLGRVAAHGGDKGIGLQGLALAAAGVGDLHSFDTVAGALQAQDVMLVQQLRAALGTQPGELLREDLGVATFVAGREGSSEDAVAEGGQRRLDLQHLVAAQHAPVHAMAAHDLGARGAVVEIGLAGEEVQDAALQPVVLDAGAVDQLLQRLVRVAAQLHQLLHVALERGRRALHQKGQAPAPLVGVQPGAEQQWRVVAQQPLGHLEGRAGIGPGLAEAHRDLGAVGEAGFQGRIGLAVDDDDLVAFVEQVPGGGDADDAGAENDDLHGGPSSY
mmetsp:Transcript_49004/g.115075  ORF Transcript_49004/g.115075 Transcript_49004/m.115075 type:complete len:405 (+) Transcript_49004:3300-4514(+)